MLLIGREREKSWLLQMLLSDRAEFFVIFGRRRIGKTYLVESFFVDQDCLFFQVIGAKEGKMRMQLAEFAKEMGRVFYGGVRIESPKTWMEAFEGLHKAIVHQPLNRPIVLFFDEFPWMATKRSQLLSTLEYYWNRHFKNDSRIKLILCGSSAAWIIQKIIYNKGGLHNRITRQIALQPFDLLETKQFLEYRGLSVNHRQVWEVYSIMGGVPYYLEQLDKTCSIAQNINSLCFRQNGLLFDEFHKLVSSLFNADVAYEELLRVIAASRSGMSRENIDEKIKKTQKGGTLTLRLRNLEMAGFIKAFLPIGHSKRGIYYRVIDEYILFYLEWIESERHNVSLGMKGSQIWLEKIQSQSYAIWVGYAFEAICYKHIAMIKKALKISVPCQVGAWRYHPKLKQEEGAQIDLLFDRQDDAITVCEIKLSSTPFVIDKAYAAILQRKCDVFRRVTRTKKQIFLAMITVDGLKKNEYSQQWIAGEVVLDDLFKKIDDE